MSDETRIPIILCCGEHGRAVVFGWVDAEPVADAPVVMCDARMILRWEGSSGIFGVAASGPSEGSRLTPSVSRVVETTWQEWLACSDEAARALAEWT